MSQMCILSRCEDCTNLVSEFDATAMVFQVAAWLWFMFKPVHVQIHVYTLFFLVAGSDKNRSNQL